MSMRLASVCRQWRVVACSTPSLWSQIDLTRSNSLKLATTLCLDRCHSPSLLTDLDFLTPRPDSNPSAFLKLAAASKKPIQRLALSWRNTLKAAVAELLGSPACTELNELVFAGCQSAAISVPATLRRLYLLGDIAHKTNWPANLTIVHIGALDMKRQTVDGILVQCQRLRELFVYLSGSEDGPQPSLRQGGPITHRSLEYLGISDAKYEWGIPRDFLHDFLLPSLRIIEIDSELTGSFDWLVDQPYPQIQRLTLAFDEYGPPDIHSIFHGLHGLVELAVRPHANEPAAQFLTAVLALRGLDGRPVLPSLKHLHLWSNYAANELPIDELVAIIRSPGRELETIDMYYLSDPDRPVDIDDLPDALKAANPAIEIRLLTQVDTGVESPECYPYSFDPPSKGLGIPRRIWGVRGYEGYQTSFGPGYKIT